MTYAIGEIYYFDIWVAYFDDNSDAIYPIRRDSK